MFLHHATQKPLLALIFVANSLCAIPSYAETDADLMASGQWRDPATGLIWMRCSIGQTWTGSTCAGQASKYTWQAAQDIVGEINRNGGFGGHINWAVPHVDELSSIRYCSNGFEKTIEIPTKKGVNKLTEYFCKKDSQRPTVDKQLFPNTPSWPYWSASPIREHDSVAWHVYFSNGGAYYGYKGVHLHVRAVRTGQ